MKKYYKVVSENLQSWVITKYDFIEVNNKRLRLIVQYKIGKFVSPNIIGSKLMIFETLEQARNFNTNGRIFEVEAKNVTNRGICLLTYEINYWLPKLFKLKKQKKRYLSLDVNGFQPPGTLFADQVKLIREIK
jgi:hypothetical protein